ncbi:hypothetical protein [Thermococcus camini]|uniref:Uncharacterized protein n=1 Tax=Thermococcus camini TaxID=2016373 RepID=A0A7G2DAB6_9EURY|nr:hypothetical protein [Thermococcus camini]CAD5244918.1 conserved protein of unknown function [Thermococcus camini]
MGATAFIIVGSRPGWGYGLPNPGYVLILYENDAPSWELRPLYPEIEDENVVWISSIEHMLEDALVMIGIYVVGDKELRRKAEKIFGNLYKEITIGSRRDVEELRKLSKEVLQRYNIGLVVVPLKDSTIMDQLSVLDEYGDLWVSLNPPEKVLGERDEW